MEITQLGSHHLSVCPHCDFLIVAQSCYGLRSAIDDHFVLSVKCHAAEDALPSLKDLWGIAPNATGELSSEEFVRKLREE